MFDNNGATLSDKDFRLLTGISVYPNPTKGMLYLKGEISKLQNIEIYSLTGQRVMEVKSNFRAINVENLRSAIYFAKLNTNVATGTIKIVKE